MILRKKIFNRQGSGLLQFLPWLHYIWFPELPIPSGRTFTLSAVFPLRFVIVFIKILSIVNRALNPCDDYEEALATGPGGE